MIPDVERKKLDDLEVGMHYQIVYSDGSDTLCRYTGEYTGMKKQDGRYFLSFKSMKLTHMIPIHSIRKIRYP